MPVKSKDLGQIVAKSLVKQYHNRKMIDVSNFYYHLHMAWRGVRTFFWRKVLKIFCSPLAREAKIGRKLKKQLFEKYNVDKQLDYVEPSRRNQKKSSSKKDESDEVSDEKSSEEDDSEGSDEKVTEKNDSSKPSKRRENLGRFFK